MFLKVVDKALFIGFEDCQYSNNAVDLLISKGFDTTFWKASKKEAVKFLKIFKIGKANIYFILSLTVFFQKILSKEPVSQQ